MRNASILLVLLTTALACGSEVTQKKDGGGGSASGVSKGGADGIGGDPCAPRPISAADVTDRDDCHGNGCGGDVCRSCSPLTVELSQPVPKEGLSVTLTTPDEQFVGCDAGPGGVHLTCGDKAQVDELQLVGPCGNSLAPESFSVEVQQNNQTIGMADFQRPSYRCLPYSDSHWCWEANAVTLTVTPQR